MVRTLRGRLSLPSICRRHKPGFTRVDFQPKIITVRKASHAAPSAPNEAKNSTDSVEEHEVTLVDWEKVGCNPTYWGYSVLLGYMAL
jgi:hypothetical protein